MESLIIKCYGSLQEKLEKEKENLKNVEANIKKIIGRNVVDSARQVRIGQKRNSNFTEPPITNTNAELWKSALETTGSSRKSWGGRTEVSSTDRIERRHRASDDFNPRDVRGGPPTKRRSIVTNSFEQPKTVFSRLSGPVRDPVADTTNYFPASRTRHTVSSQIFVTPVEVPSRSEALEVQRKDPNCKERNKRMFGALLGTLRKFKQDETKLKDRENKKAQIEKRLEEAAIREQRQLRHERDSLFKERQLKYSEIRSIELKLARLKEQEAWAASQRPLANFIRTKTAPHIFYLPKTLTTETKKLLADTKTYVTNMIAEKNKQVEKQVEEILRQGLEDHEMGNIHEEEEEDQQLEHVYHQAGKPMEQPLAEQEQQEEITLNNTSGVDQFGRDTSRRDPVPDTTQVTSTTEPPAANNSTLTISRSRSERKRSTSPPQSRDVKVRKKSSKKEKMDVTRVKKEEEAEKRKRRAEKKEGDAATEDVDVKPDIVKNAKKNSKKQRNASPSSSDSAPSTDEEASDYYYEDSDSYDENKVIKKERVDGTIKKEKDDEGKEKVNSEKETSAVRLEDADKNGDEKNGDEVCSSGDGNSREIEPPYLVVPEPVDLNSISLPGE